MSGMEPILIGSAIGAMTNPRKPLQGALLGGALGGFGGAAMGAGNAAATAGMTGATMPAAGASAGVGSTVGATLPVAKGVTGGAFATPTMPVYAATGGSTGLIPSMTAEITMADRLKALGQFNRENPMVGQVGASALQNIMQPQPMAAPQVGLLRGTPSQEQPSQYALAMPQVSLI